MPDPFWLELEAAYKTVCSNPSLVIEVQRGDKSGIVKYSPEMDVVFIKIMEVSPDVTSVELNPASMKESE